MEETISVTIIRDGVVIADCDETELLTISEAFFNGGLAVVAVGETPKRLLQKSTPIWTDEMKDAMRKAHRSALEMAFKFAKGVARSRKL